MDERYRKNERYEYRVEENTPLLEFLLTHITSKSRNTVKNLMKSGYCAADGEVVTQFDHMLRKGQTVTVSSENAVKASLPFRIIHEDEHIIVIDKPAGLLCVANDKEKDRTAYRMLSEYMKAKEEHGKVFIIHRLDRDTSGIVMFAKDAETKEAYQEKWEELAKRRIYTAVIEGEMPESEGTMRSYLRETEGHMVYVAESKFRSKEAVTHYRVIKSNGKYSLLEISIETGRKNQIRVQFADAGHPVVGDKKYGSEVNPIRRLALHANELYVKSPYGGKEKFVSSVPGGFDALCR